MLKQRVLTAMILLPLFVLAVIYLSAKLFCALTAVFVVCGAWEWASLMGIEKMPYRVIYPIVMIFMLYAAFFVPIPYVLYAAFGWWIVATLSVLAYPKMSRFWGQSKILRGLMGLLVLVPCWMAINFIRNSEDGIYMLLFLFVLVWVADTGAYFVGRKWGKHKLAPQLSPNKTWEGVLGGLVLALLIALLQLWGFGVSYDMWLPGIALSLTVVSFSVIGDLFESMMKRNANLKDSGHSLPGHGGILDRIDSLTAAAPIYALGALVVWELYH